MANSFTDKAMKLLGEHKNLAYTLSAAAAAGLAGAGLSGRSKNYRESKSDRRKRIIRSGLLAATAGAGATALGLYGMDNIATARPVADPTAGSDLGASTVDLIKSLRDSNGVLAANAALGVVGTNIVGKSHSILRQQGALHRFNSLLPKNDRLTHKILKADDFGFLVDDAASAKRMLLGKHPSGLSVARMNVAGRHAGLGVDNLGDWAASSSNGKARKARKATKYRRARKAVKAVKAMKPIQPRALKKMFKSPWATAAITAAGLIPVGIQYAARD